MDKNLIKAGVKGYDMPKKTPNHPTKARHADNIAKGKEFPAYWSDKVKW